MMAFCPEHPKWNQNPKFTPLSETTRIPAPFICGVPPPPGPKLSVHVMPLHVEVFAEGNTLKKHSIKTNLTSQLLPASPFSYTQIFSPSVCSRQNKLLVDLFTDVTLSRKPRVPSTFKSWTIDFCYVCLHFPSEKSFIKKKMKYKAPTVGPHLPEGGLKRHSW